MSRSYKKTPIVKDRNKGQKALANRTVRRKLKDSDYGMANGKSYKKEYESWNISDYYFMMTEEEAKQEWEESSKKYKWFREEYPTLESYMKWWKKTYKYK